MNAPLKAPINLLWSTANALGHPFFMPIYGFLLLHYKSRWSYEHWQSFWAIVLVLVVLPLLIYPLLKRADKVHSLHLRAVQERTWPLGINILLWSLMLLMSSKALTPNPKIILDSRLFYFFTGATLSMVLAFLMSLLKHKSSLHLMGCGGLAAWLLFKTFDHTLLQQPHGADPWVDFSVTLSTLMLVLIGLIWVALARYYSRAHNIPELISGFLAGLLPQFLVVEYLHLILQ
jgi:MFS family permease